MATSRFCMRSAMRAFTTYLAFTTLFASSANGFFPTNWRQRKFGNDGTSHEAMTDQMYDDLVAIYFPEITIRSNGMTKARKTITKANIAVDDDLPNLTAAHFDGENFEGGQERLATLFQEVIDKLDADDAEGAQMALGGAMHTLQDFYSHSNWVELGNSGPHPQVGRVGFSSLSNAAGALERTCNACIVVDPEDDDVCQDCFNNTVGFNRLTSGFYFGQDLPASGEILPQKCHHGGVTDNPRGAVMGFLFGPPTPGINKDSSNCQYSPHFFLHGEAARIALEASKLYVNDLKEELDEVKLKQLFGIGPTLAIAIDTTGSMSDVISSVRQQCINIINERLGTADEPTSYVLSLFNDPTVGPLIVTSDLEEFQASLNGVFAVGGGDCPERAVAGMIAAVEALDGGSLFMFTDAAAKDEARVGELLDKAAAKDISIYIFKFDSGCDGATARLARRDDGSDMLIKRADPASDRVYGQISLATGGQYRSLPRSDVALVSGLIDTLSTSNNRYILKIESEFGPTGTINATVQHQFPVNGRMSRLTMSVSGMRLSTRIVTPSGDLLDFADPSVSRSILSDGEVIIVQDPEAGLWTIILSGIDEYSIDVTGSDPLSFSSFDVVQVCGRDGHRGYCPITGPPAYDHDVGAVAVVEPTFVTAAFELRSPAGVVLLTLPMDPGAGSFGEPPANSFFGIFRLPNAPFYVYVTGVDTDETNYQRLLSTLITPFASGVDDSGLEDVFTEVDGEEPEMSSSSSSTSSTSSCVRTPGVASDACATSSASPTSSPTSTPSSSSSATRRSNTSTPGVAPSVPSTMETVVSPSVPVPPTPVDPTPVAPTPADPTPVAPTPGAPGVAP